jgi:hypothetical protein
MRIGLKLSETAVVAKPSRPKLLSRCARVAFGFFPLPPCGFAAAAPTAGAAKATQSADIATESFQNLVISCLFRPVTATLPSVVRFNLHRLEKFRVVLARTPNFEEVAIWPAGQF